MKKRALVLGIVLIASALLECNNRSDGDLLKMSYGDMGEGIMALIGFNITPSRNCPFKWKF